MNEKQYWIWLQRAAGKGANLERLLAPFGGDVRALYEADPKERDELLRKTPTEAEDWQREDLRSGGLRGGAVSAGSAGTSALRKKKRRPVAESTLQRMRKVSLSDAGEVLELCEQTGVSVLCPSDPHYPALLRELPTFPAALYALGDVSLFQETTLPLAMVGARDARLTSLSAASMLAESLARSGFLIVSGGAIGTDAACHIGALNAGCPTVAVLGTGIGTKYLQQNADLRRVISHNGVLLSEIEPGEPGSKGSFPLRNRIIAGMSVGTVVVEAAVKSGSLITSRYAEEYDRDIFVPLLPGTDPERPTGSSAFRGTRELLERETGVGIRCAGEVVMAYAMTYGLDPAALVASGRVTEAELLRDVTDLVGVFPPRLSQPMVVRARRQFGADLAGGGPLNPTPGWGPYRTADDASRRTYTSAEFAYRRGDHPHETFSVDGALAVSAGEDRNSHDSFNVLPFTDPPSADLLSADPPSADLPSADLPSADLPSTDLEREQEPLSVPTKKRSDLTSEALQVLSCFEPEPKRPLYYEDLSARLDMAPQYLLAALTELQLAGFVDLLSDERYLCTTNLKEEEII